MEKSKTLETSLVLTTAFLLIYFVTEDKLFLYLAVAFGITGIFIKPLAKIVAIAWFKLAEILNYFMSKIIFGTLFFLVLFPISVMYRIFGKSKLNLKNTSKSMWHVRIQKYSAADIENIW